MRRGACGGGRLLELGGGGRERGGGTHLSSRSVKGMPTGVRTMMRNWTSLRQSICLEALLVRLNTTIPAGRVMAFVTLGKPGFAVMSAISVTGFPLKAQS